MQAMWQTISLSTQARLLTISMAMVGADSDGSISIPTAAASIVRSCAPTSLMRMPTSIRTCSMPLVSITLSWHWRIPIPTVICLSRSMCRRRCLRPTMWLTIPRRKCMMPCSVCWRRQWIASSQTMLPRLVILPTTSATRATGRSGFALPIPCACVWLCVSLMSILSVPRRRLRMHSTTSMV